MTAPTLVLKGLSGTLKSRPQWHRARSANEVYKKPNTDKRDPVMTGPPIKPSTQSRTKLKKFQFLEGAPDDLDNKENMPEDGPPTGHKFDANAPAHRTDSLPEGPQEGEKLVAAFRVPT
ncbi:DNA replication factor DNA2 [Neofusicoccum parvum]|nr:DNA replication factor DNA2 [Neofusicoccum parvum]